MRIRYEKYGEEDIEKRYREFAIYFRELDRIGAPYNTDDMIRKALELSLPIISKEELNEMIDKKLEEERRTGNT